MKTGTTFNITLIADERMLGNCANCETLISVKRSSLRTAIYDEGIEFYSFGEERVLDNFADQKEKQIRQNITMVLSKPLSKNKIYQIINQVEVNAIFPEEIESKVNGETLYMGYVHIGQHTAIHEDFLNKNEVGVHKVENASYNDYKELALELEKIGYELEILN